MMYGSLKITARLMFDHLCTYVGLIWAAISSNYYFQLITQINNISCDRFIWEERFSLPVVLPMLEDDFYISPITQNII